MAFLTFYTQKYKMGLNKQLYVQSEESFAER